MSETLCVVCRRRPPARGVVCDVDLDRVTAQLADLPRLVAALTLQLVPAATGMRGDRVSTSRIGSPTTARLDALNMVGPGADGLSDESVAGMLHPLIRKWRTVRRVVVTTVIGGQEHVEDREVVEWHQEMTRKPPYVPMHTVITGDVEVEHPSLMPVEGPPVLVPSDDQTGLLPPADWLDSWAKTWRKRFGHHPPKLRGQGAAKTPAAARATAGALALHAQRQHDLNVVLGLAPGHAGAPVLRAADPLAEEWEIRYGEPTADKAVRQNVAYLLAWFEQACVHDVGVADFAAELRSLTAELTRVVGEMPDEQWLGRCPSRITDRETGTSRTCGAGLWQDPYASQVVCPRCRSTWGPRRVELFYLVSEIRRVWPIDRRRRYTTAEANEALDVDLKCPGCGRPVDVAWRNVTAPEDRETWWRAERAVCENRCPEAGRVI